MATHSVYYPDSSEVVTPWNAKYTYPAQANKARKFTPRIPPKNGASFSPGNQIRLEFPAQGYVNTLNTTMEFDVVLYGPVNASVYMVRFQNNIQSIFNRIRLLYGSDVSEDLQRYNVLVRALTEWTATNQQGIMDQTSISEGIGGYTTSHLTSFVTGSGTATVNAGFMNTRQHFIQGICGNQQTNVATQDFLTQGTWLTGTPVGTKPVPNSAAIVPLPGGCPNPISGQTACVRRYQINFALGVFTQDKLIPVRYMASQLVIEITLENSAACIYQPVGLSTNTTPPSYMVGNVNLIPEILEFDDTYDAAFLEGLESGGVPIKFSTWNYFPYTTQGSGQINVQVNERSRSVKGMLVVQRRGQDSFAFDNGALLYDSNSTYDSTGIVGSTLQQFQFRIGGIYYPGQPVQCSINNGSPFTNGACEAYVELSKFLNIVGDYRLSSNCNVKNWAVPAYTNLNPVKYNEYDFSYTELGYQTDDVPNILQVESAGNGTFCGNLGSSCFAASINFETSNGMEISGLNAEEQSDISVNIIWSGTQTTGFLVEVFTYVDRMWVLRPNNYLDLIR